MTLKLNNPKKSADTGKIVKEYPGGLLPFQNNDQDDDKYEDPPDIITEFQPEWINPTDTIGVFGMTGAGKTFTICDILHEIGGNYSMVIAMSPTKVNSFWSTSSNKPQYIWNDDKKEMVLKMPRIPDHWVFEHYNEDVMAKLIQHQKEFLEGECVVELENGNHVHKNPNKLVILEDVIGDGVHDSQILSSLFAKVRHIHLSIIILVQHITAISTVARENCRHAFIFRLSTKLNVDNVIDNFMGLLERNESRKIYRHIALDYENPHQCLVYSKYPRIMETKSGAKKAFNYFKYTADPNVVEKKQWQLSSESFWNPEISKSDDSEEQDLKLLFNSEIIQNLETRKTAEPRNIAKKGKKK